MLASSQVTWLLLRINTGTEYDALTLVLGEDYMCWHGKDVFDGQASVSLQSQGFEPQGVIVGRGGGRWIIASGECPESLHALIWLEKLKDLPCFIETSLLCRPRALQSAT